MVAANVTNTYVVPAGSKVAPYYDDFDEAKNFHRILFRPGYAVQARELTQLQTIMQNQVERFGRHIFENGSPVIGGDIYIPDGYSESINLSPTYGSSNTEIVSSQFKDKVVVLSNGSSNVKFRVIATTEATENDPPVIYGDYLTSDRFFDGTTIKVDNEEVYANITPTNSSTYSRLAFLRDSIFFYDGYFVKVPKQVTVIGKYYTSPTCKVGLELNDEITTENEDTTLLDPALGASNYQAPGAARYKMDLTLTSRDINSTDDTKFIELARVESGVLTKQIKFPVYSEIEEVLARRTYDESGNYTVRPFIVRFDYDNYDPVNNVSAVISPGKAYIYGYEYETISETRLHIPKGRTLRQVEGYNLNLNYGNYVYVDNLRGEFDYNSMQLFDIHCVDKANVDFTSNTTYQKTKIGTGRVRDLEFYSGDVDTDARKYEFYLFDTNFRSITSNALSVTSNTITLFNSSSLLSATSNCYDGAVIRVVSGTGSGASYPVESYNGASKLFTLTTNFAENPDANSNIALEFDFAESESFVIHKSYTPGAVSNANCNISTLNKTDGVSSGSAFILEPSLNTLIFNLPDEYLANGVSNTTYVFKKKYSDVDFSSGVTPSAIAAETNEQFVGATASSNIASTVMENFFIVVTDKKSSGRANGDVVKCTVSISGTPEQATFSTSNTDVNDVFRADVYATMEYKLTGGGINSKTKTFNEANAKTLSSETSVNLTGWNTGSYANVYANAAQVVIHSPSRNPGVPETLYLSDVIGIEKIYDLNGQSLPVAGADITGYIDVTDRYSFNNGQRDTHYDHASISLKPDYAPCVGPLIVCCYYYKHSRASGEGNYFDVDSYITDINNPDIISNGRLIGDWYGIIPEFIDTKGNIIRLQDCIDFRPSRTNASNTWPNYSMSEVSMPSPTTDMELSYQYYLGRRDLIVLTANRTIERVPGVASKNPKEPSAPSRTMVLYSIGIPPYTEYPTDIRVKYIDNKRYTMRDIGKIDKRVENLEYYVSLNTLEKKALDISITDVNGLERTKYGIFADSFAGHSLGNSDLEDYRCSMNLKEGYLTAQANTTGFFMEVQPSLSSDVKITRDKVVLDYEETILDSQPNATKSAPVAEFLFGKFDGNIVTLPEADIWKSSNVDPDIVYTDSDTVEYTHIKVYESIVDSQSRLNKTS